MSRAVANRWVRAVLLALAAWLAMPAAAQERQPPSASLGVLDLRGWDFEADGIAALDGQWLIQWGRFDDPAATVAADAQPIEVPGPWNDLRVAGAAAGPYGRATYRLAVQCGVAPRLALRLPVQHSAARWYVNGVQVATQGSPGATAQAARPGQLLQIAHLGAAACPLNIVAHVSNFDVRRGGLMRGVEVGDAVQMHRRHELALTRDVATIGALLVMGVLPLLFFVSRRKDLAPLYFGLFCLSFALGMGLTGTRVFQSAFAPLGWDGYLQLTFVSWYSAIVWFSLFVQSLYPAGIRRRPVQAVAAMGGLLCVGVLLTPASVFSYLLPPAQAWATLAALYLGWQLARLALGGRRSAALLLGGLVLFVAAVAHDAARFQHLQRLALIPFGVLVFTAVPALLMLRRFARALSVEERLAIEQRERADLLVRSTQAGVLDWDAIANRTTWSDRYREMLGYPSGPGAPDPPNFRLLLHPDDHDRVHGSFMRQLRERGVRSGVRVGEPMDYRLRRADGSYLWVHAEAVSVCGEDGRTLRYICSFIDISQAKRHELEMENRVKFTHDLFDSIPIALALRDGEGRYLLVNRTWEQYMGLKRSGVLGMALRELDGSLAAAGQALDREALALPAGSMAQPRELDANGRRYMQSRTLMADARGAPIGVLTASLDITEKYAVEQQLAMERERLRLLVRSTQAGFGDWDAQRDVVTYSGRFKEMLGWPADTDTTGWPSIFDMMHPDDSGPAREQFRRMISRKAEGGERMPGESMSYRLRRRDGSYIWIHAEGIAQLDELGRTRRFITSYLDVTAFRQQEEALRAQVALTRTEQLRLDLVVRAALVGIVDWDGRTHQTYYSPRFREIRGYPSDADTAGWPDYFLVMIHPDDRERVSRRWVAFIRGKGPEGPRGEFYSPEEYRLLRADGSYAWVRVSGMAVRDEDGFVLRWIAAIIDITERHEQEVALRASHDQIAAQAAQLELQNEALKENVRLREEVERIGRHDIKTPLNSIVAVPRLLREERRLGAEADELLGIVERAGYRILSMVNLSLDLYKMEQGTYVLRPDAVDLEDLVGKVIADVRMHAESKQVRLDVRARGVPFAWAEELLCYSLLANLLKNAVEASPVGAVVSVRAQAGEGGTVRLAIHNDGVVPEAIRANFFQKYATLGKASGTGLGTYSARLMARVQDGDIAMESAEATGTTLTVTLRAAPEGAVPAMLRHAAERRGIEPGQIASLPPMRVLLVDDDEYNLLVVRRFLPTPPFTVDTAINGRVALGAAELQWPDVVFMDLDMPVMGGLEAVKALRLMERATLAPRCTMIALSSHEDDETRARALAAGFDRYLTKPVTREVINEALLELNVLIGQALPAAAPAGPAAVPGPDEPVLVDPDVEPVLAEFLDSRRELVDAMLRAIDADDRAELRRIAHLLAGSFALYGFLWAGEQARWIERHFTEAGPGRLRELAAAMRHHLDRAEVRIGPMAEMTGKEQA